MYSVIEQATEMYHLYKDDVLIGILTCEAKETDRIITMLNTHPLADEDL